MTNESDTEAAMLPGFESPPEPKGSLAAAVAAQISALRSLGYIEANHSAQVELALVAARDIDRSFGRGAPSGRANLLRVMNEILESLPQPEAASKDLLDEVVSAMMHDDEDEVSDAVSVLAAP
ncbi:hypothetical protein EV379_0902 [Microterricola gilva]|uniref:Uncharacterized protein n=1 Tax=Microterricola gilva TaxID=393267 RepID=A0A4Q8AL54_9MICO|nr:hypothetical protein [Microterricola gilva]RZU64599.1 hypothetical protein EV379_0902 [Microterricola gilva]